MKKFAWLTALVLLVVMIGSIVSAQAKIIPPYGEGQIGLQAVVLCEELTMRAGSNASAQVVKKLKYGSLINVDRQVDGWAHCVFGDSEESPSGWVNADYIIIDPAWYRTERRTPVYAWDNTGAPKVALLNSNTTLPIVANEGDWLIVSLRGAVGFVQK